MRRLFLFLPLLLLIVSCASSEVPTVSVTGSAALEIDPDSISFTVTASCIAPTTEEAGDAASALMNSALLIMEEHGILPEDIRTVHFSVYPEYSYRDGESVLSGQRATVSDAAVLRDTEGMGDLIESLSSLDGIQIGSIEPMRSDSSLEMNKVRSLAVQDAYSRASAYAVASGYSLGSLISVSTEGTAPSAEEARLYSAVSASGGTEYYAGTITLTDSVRAVYSLVE